MGSSRGVNETEGAPWLWSLVPSAVLDEFLAVERVQLGCGVKERRGVGRGRNLDGPSWAMCGEEVGCWRWRRLQRVARRGWCPRCLRSRPKGRERTIF